VALEPYIDAHSHIWTPDVAHYPLAEGFRVENMDPRSFTAEELLARLWGAAATESASHLRLWPVACNIRGNVPSCAWPTFRPARRMAPRMRKTVCCARASRREYDGPCAAVEAFIEGLPAAHADDAELGLGLDLIHDFAFTD
jgi:hypothetical protein